MRVWRNDLDLDREFVITSGAWRLSHFDTLPPLYILETKQIKNAWWSGTYLEFRKVLLHRADMVEKCSFLVFQVFSARWLDSSPDECNSRCFLSAFFFSESSRYSHEWSKWKVKFTWAPKNVIGNDGAFVFKAMNSGRNPGLLHRSERGWIKIWLKAN